MRLSAENYYGSAALAQRSDNYFIALTTYKNAIKVPTHSHENPYLSINLGCAYLEHSVQSTQLIGTGQVLYRPASHEHRNEFVANKGVCFNIELLSTVDAKLSSRCNEFNLKQASLSLQKICAAYLNGYHSDELDCLIHHALLFDDTGDSSRGAVPSWYTVTIDYIHDQYDQTIKLKDIASVTNVHPNYICRKFKQINGLNVGEYIRQVRLVKAFEMMLSRQSNLTHIGLAAGFYDQAHFSKCFKRTYGSSPKKLQAKYQKLISYN